MDRLERLLNLVATLLATDRLLLAEEVRVRVPGYPESAAAFQRAFSRDKATLREMEIPLEMEQLHPGDPESGFGYRIPRHRYELPDLGLEPDEVAALHLASTAVQLEGNDATEAIWKLGGVDLGAISPATSPATSPGPATASLPGSEHLPAMFGAAAAGQTLRFDYRGATRTVDPWQLNFRNGSWYLTGWDHERQERRRFRLDRLTSAPSVVEGLPFTAPPPASSGGISPWLPWEMGDEEPADVRVAVDADQARWALSAAGENAVEERRADGSVVLRLRVSNRNALRTFVLGMLDHAEILSPDEERAALVEWVRSGLKAWGG